MTEPILTIIFIISCLVVLLVFAPKSRFMMALAKNKKITSDRDRMFIRGIGELIASFAAYPAVLLFSMAFNALVGESIPVRYSLFVVVIAVNFLAAWGLRRWWKKIILTLNGYAEEENAEER